MSLTSTPNSNDYIARIGLILQNSALIFPNSVGGDPDEIDLVQQIILYEIPQLENPPAGGGPPHIVIMNSKNPILERKQVGRDDRNTQGPEALTLEFYIICITQGTDLLDAQKQNFALQQAVTTTLDKNKRMTDLSGNNPLSKSSQWITVPYLLDIEQRELISYNVVFRPEVYLNLRS